MAQEKAPYVKYFEDVERSGFSNEAEIPIFIGSSLYAEKAPKVSSITRFNKLSQVVHHENLGAEIKLKYKKDDDEIWVSSPSEAPEGYIAVLDPVSGDVVTKQDKFVTLIADFVEENSKYGADENEVLYFYVLDVPKTTTIEQLVQKIADSKTKRDASVIVVDLEDDTYNTTTGAYNPAQTLTSKMESIAAELNNEIVDGILRIAYCGLDKPEGVADSIYETRITTIIRKLSEVSGCSRIGLIEKELMGKTIARICTTPYYEEPGYAAYKSVGLGIFDERTIDNRDTLFNAGLIFNEDDYTQPSPVARICLATSCAWGTEDVEYRRADALIHARRNVDYQVRQILKLVSPQLKRNETSVNIAFIRTDVLNYLAEQKRLGRIIDYAISVDESETNPYQLHIYGSMIPVNSTMAIEFNNYIGSPVLRAEDYV